MEFSLHLTSKTLQPDKVQLLSINPRCLVPIRVCNDDDFRKSFVISTPIDGSTASKWCLPSRVANAITSTSIEHASESAPIRKKIKKRVPLRITEVAKNNKNQV